MKRLFLPAILLALAAIAVLAQPAPKAAAAPAARPAPSASAIDATVDRVADTIGLAAGKVTHDPAFSGQLAEDVRGFFAIRVVGFSLAHLAGGFFILLFTLVLRKIIAQGIIARLKRLAAKTATDLDTRLIETIEPPLSLFLLIFGIYLAVLVFPLDAGIATLVDRLFRGLTMLTVVWAGVRTTDLLVDVFERRIEAHPGSALVGFLPLIKKALKIFVLIVGVLLVVDNLGYNITGIIATLGLGTAAVALASQDSLKNGFGALMIMLDRPFTVGDWIQVGDKVDGNVEAIGLRSTKVRTWPKTVLSIPNGVLANEYINNWSRMPKRRVKQTIGITYEATSRDMEALVEDFRGILRRDADVNQEFILVSFTDFGESSLNILVYYFTKSTDWLTYMDVRQRINCAMMRAIEARGLSVAFPTRTLYMDGAVASKLADVPYQSRWDRAGGTDHPFDDARPTSPP
jgi:MscS family membrane protein